MASTARIVIDELRGRGEKIGLLKIRFFRPFPYDEIRKTLEGRKKVIVIDRNLSPGMGGIFAQEIRNALHGASGSPQIIGTITGLGGRDITPQSLSDIIHESEKLKDTPNFWHGLNETEVCYE